MKFDPKLAAQEYFSKHAAECEVVSCTYTNSPNFDFFNSLAAPATVVLALYLAHKFGWAIGLRNLLERYVSRSVVLGGLFGTCLTVYVLLVLAPVRFYQQVILRKGGGGRFVMNLADGSAPFETSSFPERISNWLERYTIDGLIWIIAAAVLVPTVLLVIRLLPRLYWAIAALAYAVFLTVSYTDVPYEARYDLPESPLKRDIATMAQAAGVPMDRIHIGKQERFLGSRLDAHANWVDGAQRVVIGESFFNTLPFSPAIISPSFVPMTAAEVRAVAGHELAHISHNHLYWLNGVSALLTFLLAWLAHFSITRSVRQNPELRSVGDLSTAPVIAAMFSIAIFALTILQVNIHRIAENQADATGLDLARDPDGFARLALRDNRTRPLKRESLVEGLVITHPDGETRIQRAMDWKAVNTPTKWQSTGLSGPVRVRCAGDQMVSVSETDWKRRNVCTIDNEWDDEEFELK